MPPDDAALIDRLAALPLFQSVPRHELAWLAAHGEQRTLEAGTVVSAPGAPIDEMFILIAGRAGLYVEKGGGSRKLLEAVTGQVLGTLPYSRVQRSPGVVYRSVQLNDDRLQSLSRLASGFAHELNNPASAAARTAQSLVGLLDEEERAARELAAARLGDDQFAAVDAVRQECGRTAQTRTALAAADREDDIAEWLTRHGIEPAAAEACRAYMASAARSIRCGRSWCTTPSMLSAPHGVPRKVAG